MSAADAMDDVHADDAAATAPAPAADASAAASPAAAAPSAAGGPAPSGSTSVSPSRSPSPALGGDANGADAAAAVAGSGATAAKSAPVAAKQLKQPKQAKKTQLASASASVSGKAPIPCPKCAVVFASNNKWNAHMRDTACGDERRQQQAAAAAAAPPLAPAPTALATEVHAAKEAFVVLLCSPDNLIAAQLRNMEAISDLATSAAIEQLTIEQLVLFLHIPPKLKLGGAKREVYHRWMLLVLSRLEKVLQWGPLTASEIAARVQAEKAAGKQLKRGFRRRHAASIEQFHQAHGDDILENVVPEASSDMHVLIANVKVTVNRDINAAPTPVRQPAADAAEAAETEIRIAAVKLQLQDAVQAWRVNDHGWSDAGASDRHLIDECLVQLFLNNVDPLPNCICCYGIFGNVNGEVGTVGKARRSHLLSFWYQDQVKAHGLRGVFPAMPGSNVVKMVTQAANNFYFVQCADCEGCELQGRQSDWEKLPKNAATEQFIADLRTLRENGRLEDEKQPTLTKVPHHSLFRFTVVNTFRLLLKWIDDTGDDDINRVRLDRVRWQIYDRCRTFMHSCWTLPAGAPEPTLDVHLYVIPLSGSLFRRVELCLFHQKLWGTAEEHWVPFQDGNRVTGLLYYEDPLYILATVAPVAGFECFKLKQGSQADIALPIHFLPKITATADDVSPAAASGSAASAASHAAQWTHIQRRLLHTIVNAQRQGGQKQRAMLTNTRENPYLQRVASPYQRAAGQFALQLLERIHPRRLLDLRVLAEVYLAFRALYPVWLQTGTWTCAELIQHSDWRLALDPVAARLIELTDSTSSPSKRIERFHELCRWELRHLMKLFAGGPLLNTLQQLIFFFHFLYHELPQFSDPSLSLLLGLDHMSTEEPSIVVTPMEHVHLYGVQGYDRMVVRVQRIRVPESETAKKAFEAYKDSLQKTCCQGCGLERRKMPSALKCGTCRKVYYCNKACQLVDWKRPNCPHSVFCSTYDCRPVLLSAQQDGTLVVVAWLDPGAKPDASANGTDAAEEQ
jgi:hypothetical protein